MMFAGIFVSPFLCDKQVTFAWVNECLLSDICYAASEAGFAVLVDVSGCYYAANFSVTCYFCNSSRRTDGASSLAVRERRQCSTGFLKTCKSSSLTEVTMD